MHALAAAGASALSPLLRTLQDSSAAWWVRAAAASAIGSLGPGCDSDGVVEALSTCLANEDEAIWLRRNCAESIGYVLSPAAPDAAAALCVGALTQALGQCDSAEITDFEYDMPGSYLETVRQAAASSLARVAAHAYCATEGGAAVAEAARDAFHKPIGEWLSLCVCRSQNCWVWGLVCVHARVIWIWRWQYTVYIYA